MSKNDMVSVPRGWLAAYLDNDGVKVEVDGVPTSLWELLSTIADEPASLSTPVKMRGMESAPRDGTHILIKYVVSHYTDDNGRHRFKDYRPVGHKWEELRFVDGEFRPWAGTDRVNQIGGGGEPIGWAPLPLEASE